MLGGLYMYGDFKKLNVRVKSFTKKRKSTCENFINRVRMPHIFTFSPQSYHMLDNQEDFPKTTKPYGNKFVETAMWFWSFIPPLHPAGWPFVAIFAFVTILLALVWHGFLIIGIVLTLWCAYFFRNPAR